MGKTLRRTPTSRGKREHGDNALRDMRRSLADELDAQDRRESSRRERREARQTSRYQRDYWTWT